MSESTKITDMRKRRFRWVLALMVLCLLSASASALALEGQPVEIVSESPQDLHLEMTETSLADVLRTGEQPFQCGHPREEFHLEEEQTRVVPEVDCRIKAKLTIPAKAANWLGLGSTLIASGVAGNMVEHFKEGHRDLGRTYFLKIDNIGALRTIFKRKRVHALSGYISGSATAVGGEKVFCGSPGSRKSCPIPGNAGAGGFEWQDKVVVCWVFRGGWWVGVAPAHYGEMCPKPI